jgi:hypothetical protein
MKAPMRAPAQALLATPDRTANGLHSSAPTTHSPLLSYIPDGTRDAVTIAFQPACSQIETRLAPHVAYFPANRTTLQRCAHITTAPIGSPTSSGGRACGPRLLKLPLSTNSDYVQISFDLMISFFAFVAVSVACASCDAALPSFVRFHGPVVVAAVAPSVKRCCWVVVSPTALKAIVAVVLSPPHAGEVIVPSTPLPSTVIGTKPQVKWAKAPPAAGVTNTPGVPTVGSLFSLSIVTR